MRSFECRKRQLALPALASPPPIVASRNPTSSNVWQPLRADMVVRTTAMLTASGLEAVKSLLGLQHPTAPPAVRLGAARSVLELGAKLREATELAERVATLEQHFAASDKSWR